MSVHINALPGQIAPVCLLPGDPLRAKFIAENWKGTLYAPSGKQQNFRIYVLDAEVAIRNQQTVENLKKLAQFKTEK